MKDNEEILNDLVEELDLQERLERRHTRKKNPVDDNEFTYNIILSKGTGKLTRKAEKYIYILVQEAIKKILYKFIYQEDVEDAIQTGYYQILTGWQKFNPDKAPSAFVYFTEIQKRAAAQFINKWIKMKGINKKDYSKFQRISINNANNGEGLFNI